MQRATTLLDALSDVIPARRNVGQVTYGSAISVWHGGVRRWICYLLSFLRIHRPDCELCSSRETCWVEVKKRLEDLR